MKSLYHVPDWPRGCIRGVQGVVKPETGFKETLSVIECTAVSSGISELYLCDLVVDGRTYSTNIAGCGWLIAWAAKAAQVFSGKPNEPLILVPRKPDAPSAVSRSARRDAQLAHQCRSALGFRVNCGTHQCRSALGFRVFAGTL